MREDIVGMLKNAIERGGRPEQIAQSLISSGYNAMEVQQALSFVTGGTLSSLNSPYPSQNSSGVRPLSPGAIQQRPTQMPMVPAPPQYIPRPLPAIRPQGPNSQGVAKLMILILVLVLLVGGLVSTIIFKENILDMFG